nr:transglutaminase-like domain-containing protein [uncultured Desulfobacter sp.]
MHNLPLKKLFIFTAILVCIGAVFWLIQKPVSPQKAPQADPQAGQVIPRHISYSFTLRNTTGQLIEKPEFWTYAPLKKTPSQSCTDLQTSHAYTLITDELGNQILHFSLPTLPPYGSKTITIQANLIMSDTPDMVKVINLKPFLKSEKYIESDNTELLTLARRLKASAPSTTAERIFQWVTNHITYSGFSGKNRGALFALKSKKGDCTEFMYLFTALCRANGIPARCMAGYVCSKNEILKPGAYHNWAEIYEGNTWQVADPQKHIFKQHSSQFIVMRILGKVKENPMGSHHRFRFKGQGLKVKMNG